MPHVRCRIVVRWCVVTTTFRTSWLAGLLGLLLGGGLERSLLPAQQVDFGREIKPILSDTCYQCHGPDAEQRQADLRLDLREGALATDREPAVIVPGAPGKSELWRRIHHPDPDEQMPPPSADRQLSEAQRKLLGRWIQEGAAWQNHWSFVMPGRPALPAASVWIRNPIDSFILNRIEEAGLEPSSPASRETLIRRLTLDLTGLPPTQRQLDGFLADESPQAYQRLVDRLLASPRYGERMAMQWLDAARYADTNGYQTDGIRYMWRWRDWVINALNRNQPFDQFTIEQLAGDLLPDPTPEQILATGFNRNHRANSEGGIVPEEFLVEYAVDRVNTTATIWLGLTMGCARCHSHKYDPISQREFYQVMAFFNNLPERGRVIKHGNSFPMMKSPTQQMVNRLAGLEEQIAAVEIQLQQHGEQIQESLRNWSANYEPRAGDDRSVDHGLAVRLDWDDLQNPWIAEPGEDPDKLSVPDGQSVVLAEGVQGRALQLSDGRFVEAGGMMGFAGDQPLTLTTWVHPFSVQTGTIMSMLNVKNDRATGFTWKLVDNHLHVKFGPRWLDDAIIFQTQDPLPVGQWSHLALLHDGSQLARGFQLYVNGELQELDVLLDLFTGSFTTAPTLKFGSGHDDANLDGLLDETRFYTRTLKPEEVRILATSESIQQIMEIPQADRTPGQQNKLYHLFMERYVAEPMKSFYQRQRKLERERDAQWSGVPTVMVMQESPQRRATFLLQRGQYDKPGEEVAAGIPAGLIGGKDRQVRTRLEFAHWLVDGTNPLTARVTVNRFWHLHFGRGLVRTLEDFGSQGDVPTHPQLLDWLASEFVERGWDVKALHRLIVTSATYQQSAVIDDQHLVADPANLLLARAPRLRLQAEMVRDQALATGGLLVNSIGGPSVKPYQPEGLWKEIASQVYVRDNAEKLYRRSVYTFWKRTVPPPMMMTFDAASRETCVLSRSRTNTPLQALTLLNDVTFVEAARALASQMMSQGVSGPRDRLDWGFRQLTARRATARELGILEKSFKRALARYQADEESAGKLVGFGEMEVPVGIDRVRLAAYTNVANLMMNLDEVVNRE
ncbi:MAG: hypothetical protein CMJ81_18025 [Planctomycetaceae bacterium]|nr:hypothetical protein [Planctomycetaceae bacterium]MBP60032.1 hypothetical protein [Planctomycetaceae bacterium]